MHEQPPQIEKEKSYLEKHNNWLREAKIASKSFLGGVGGGLIGIAILKTLIPEFDLPPHIMAGMFGGLTITLYDIQSRKQK